MNQGSVNEKRAVLKEIDEDFDISFSREQETYSIYHKGYLFQNVPWDGFTREVLDGIRKVVWLNKNGNIANEVDKNNEKIDINKDKKLSDMSRQLAKDIRKPLIREVCGA
jgi:hypothetical protein